MAQPLGPSESTLSLQLPLVYLKWPSRKGSEKHSVSTACLYSRKQGTHILTVSGEGLFVKQVTGTGIIWVQSLGAIVQRRLGNGEQWIGESKLLPSYDLTNHATTVDNGHLVAWSAKYTVERVDAGGFISASHTDEGLVCRYVVS